MKQFKWIAVSLFTASVLFGFVACSDGYIHFHTYDTKWTSNDKFHWHKATCEHTSEVTAKALHTFDVWEIVTEATEEKTGLKERSCTVCAYTQQGVIPQKEVNNPEDNPEDNTGDNPEDNPEDNTGDNPEDNPENNTQEPEETEDDFDKAAKECAVDAIPFVDVLSAGIWDYKLSYSYTEPELGTFKEEYIGFCVIYGMDSESKVKTTNTFGKETFICDSKEIYDEIKAFPEASDFSDNAEFNDEELKITEIFCTEESPEEEITTFDDYMSSFMLMVEKTNQDNTVYVTNYSDDVSTVKEIYVKRTDEIPNDEENIPEDIPEDIPEEPSEPKDIFEIAEEECVIASETLDLSAGIWDYKASVVQGSEYYTVDLTREGFFDVTANNPDSEVFMYISRYIVKLIYNSVDVFNEVYNEITSNPEILSEIGFTNNAKIDSENLTISEIFEDIYVEDTETYEEILSMLYIGSGADVKTNEEKTMYKVDTFVDTEGNGIKEEFSPALYVFSKR